MVDSTSTTKGTPTVTPHTQYSINVDENGPVVPFFEAHAAAMASDASSTSVLLNEQDFTIWQPSTAPQETVVGLNLTPP